MMEEMMKACCGLEGKPDFEKMKAFMESCGKAQFGEEEVPFELEAIRSQSLARTRPGIALNHRDFLGRLLS